MPVVGLRIRRLLGIGPLWLVMGLLRLRSLPRLLPGPSGLSVDQPLELSAVEEDPSTLGALVDCHVAALVASHLPVAFRAHQIVHRTQSSGDASRQP